MADALELAPVRLAFECLTYVTNATGTHTCVEQSTRELVVEPDELFEQVIARLRAGDARVPQTVTLTGAPDKWEDEVPPRTPLGTYLPEMRDGHTLTLSVWLPAGASLHADASWSPAAARAGGAARARAARALRHAERRRSGPSVGRGVVGAAGEGDAVR